MADVGAELDLRLSGAGPPLEARPEEERSRQQDKVTHGAGGQEEQDASGSLIPLEHELLTLETEPQQEQLQVLTIDAAGAALESPTKAENQGGGEVIERITGHELSGSEAGVQGPGAARIEGASDSQPGSYGTGLSVAFEGPTKVEDGERKRGLHGAPGSGAFQRERTVGEGLQAGLELRRQDTEESLGRMMEGGREKEDGAMEGEDHDGRGQANKKQRLVWTAELHSRFMNAVNHLGVKNAVPKTILQLMNVEGMTRENVASHLQKYRLYLKRLAGLPPNARLSPELVQGGSHLYPYVHQPHEVPPPMMMPHQSLHQGYPPAGAPYYPLPHRTEASGAPVLGSPPQPSADSSASGQKPGEGRAGDAAPQTYPASVSTIPPSPPHFGYTPEMYGNFSSMSHGGWHPLPGPGPGQAPSGQYRPQDPLPGSPVPPAQGTHYAPTAGTYGAPVGASLYGAAGGTVPGVGSPASVPGSTYGYTGTGGVHYGSPAGVAGSAGTGSPPTGQRGSAPVLQQYAAPSWQQETSPGGGFGQLWMQPAVQDWQKRWPDAGQQQRKW